MILRAKNKDLFESQLTDRQKENSRLNLMETEQQASLLVSYPRRIVAELTNACNIHCIMCGREHADFKPSFFDMRWFNVLEEAFTYTEEIVLHGWGEPTIHPEFERILNYLNQYPLRKYFCTNGTTLHQIQEMLFKYHVDIMAVSLDGADSKTNNAIRCGSHFDEIVNGLKAIVQTKKDRHLSYPYINFVFTAMRSNIDQLSDMIRLASDIGVAEVKVVYLTSFSESMDQEGLYHCKDKVRMIFDRSFELAQSLGVMLKLPFIQGDDPAGIMLHRECFFPYRDLFIGSDGFVRPCVSSSDQLFDIRKIGDFKAIWNHQTIQQYRKAVNDISQMHEDCRKCYHSSCANWNKKSSFIQTGEIFAPQWQMNEIKP